MADKKIVVAFLGPEGTYTHQAAQTRFPDRTTHTLVAAHTIPDVFHSVAAQPGTLGVVPLENSTNGSVVTTLDLFCQLSRSSTATTPTTPSPTSPTSPLSSSIQILAEVYLPVHHTLCASPSLPSAEAITKLYSHPQAWGQCTRFLRGEAWKRVEKQDVSSTSRGAEMVAAEGAGSTAGAISSAVAARMYGLQILQEAIEDVSGNCTRFLVLGQRRRRGGEEEKEKEKEEDGEAGKMMPREEAREKRIQEDDAVPDDDCDDGDDDDFKTLVTFTVSHSEPGALADCLAVFKAVGLNLTSINSRPSGDAPWHYVFLVEFIGRRRKGDDEGKVNAALRELDKVATGWRWMGSWRNQLLAR